MAVRSSESADLGVLHETSATANRLKPSSTVAMTDLAGEMRREGLDVISLSVGEPDFGTPARIGAAGARAIAEGQTKYSPNAGLASLREAVARKLAEENGIAGLDPAGANVVVTNGAKQAIAEAVLATCAAGDQVVVPAPYWVSYPEMARLAGAEPVVVETRLEENFLLTPEALEQALTPASRVLILCSPSNPTGSVYSRAQLQVRHSPININTTQRLHWSRENAVERRKMARGKRITAADLLARMLPLSLSLPRRRWREWWRSTPGCWSSRTRSTNTFSTGRAAPGRRRRPGLAPSHPAASPACRSGPSRSTASPRPSP